jgi:hypothetical protein
MCPPRLHPCSPMRRVRHEEWAGGGSEPCPFLPRTCYNESNAYGGDLTVWQLSAQVAFYLRTRNPSAVIPRSYQ